MTTRIRSFAPMRIPSRVQAILASALLLTAPLGASLFDFEARSSLDVQVKLTQAAMCDGSVRLAPGVYDVHVTTTADGKVSAGFFQGGVKRGEAHGIIAVRKAGGSKTHSFTSLGLGSSSPSALKAQGQNLSLEIGAPGTNQVLIGLALPAVQK